MDMECGLVPTGKLDPAAKVPSPFPRSTDTVLDPKLVTARSSRPSPVRSTAATKDGLTSVAKLWAAWKVPSPFPSSTETLFDVQLHTARSFLPSPLKSPTATQCGLVP